MKQITIKSLTHKELVEVLCKHFGITEGIWGLHAGFQLAGTNSGSSDDDLCPTGLLRLVEIGLQPFEKVTGLSIDASQVNTIAAGAVEIDDMLAERAGGLIV